MARRNRWEFLNEFTKDASGEYIYTGEYVLPEFGDRRVLWALTILSAAIVVGSGCIDAAGMHDSFYVILPYIGEVTGMFLFVWNSVKLLRRGGKIRKYVYESATKLIVPAAVVMGVFALVGAVCAVVHTVLKGFEGGALMCSLYIALKLAGAAVGLLAKKRFGAIHPGTK